MEQKSTQRPVIKEGKAQILTTYTETNKQGQLEESEVFYNPLQVFNRDLTIAIINQYTKDKKEKRKEQFDGVTILDALSASGLRTIRFLKELKDIKLVYANDISEASHRLMMDNFKLNELDLSKIRMTRRDANELMYEQKFLKYNKGIFDDAIDVIDLDPYGSAVPFLDAAIQCARTDSLLCITCTDSKVLCGPDVQKCFYQYGSARATKIPSLQECEACSNHHIHTYGKAKQNSDNYFNMYNLNKFKLPSNVCDICGSELSMNGPIWLDDIHDFEFLEKLLASLEAKELELAQEKKIIGIVKSILQEKKTFKEQQVPPYGVSTGKICKLTRSTQPSIPKLQAAFQSLGYQFVHTFTNPDVFKTDAPNHIPYEIIKSFKLQSVGEENLFKNLEQDSVGYKILQRELTVKPDFDFKIEQTEKFATFIPNEKRQGPLKRAVVNHRFWKLAITENNGEQQDQKQEMEIEQQTQQTQQENNNQKDNHDKQELNDETVKKIKTE